MTQKKTLTDEPKKVTAAKKTKAQAKPAQKKAEGETKSVKSKTKTSKVSKTAKPKTAKPKKLSPEATTPDHFSSKGESAMSDTAALDVSPAQAKSNIERLKLLIRGKFQPYVPTADEEYMSVAQLEHFKLILNDWKQELMNEVDRTVDHMKDESSNLPDPVDRATQEEEFNLELRTRDRERKLIKKIDKTLEAILSDEYGFCEDCGIEIGLRRLEARPTANLCIDCKTLAEIKEKQFRN